MARRKKAPVRRHLVRPNQRAITAVLPHNGNRRVIVPKRVKS